MKDESTNIRIKNSNAIKRKDLLYPELCYKIIGALFEVHNSLGGALQEKHYQKALALSLKDKEINFKEQVEVPIKFKGEKTSNYFLDFLVEDKVVIELKTKRFTKDYYDQLLSYLKTANIKLGVVAVFGKDELRYKRIVNLY